MTIQGRRSARTGSSWIVPGSSASTSAKRLDGTVLVLDLEAGSRSGPSRLRDRPVAGIEAKKLAKATDGYTDADIAHLYESAAEIALLEAAETGKPGMIGQADIEAPR